MSDRNPTTAPSTTVGEKPSVEFIARDEAIAILLARQGVTQPGHSVGGTGEVSLDDVVACIEAMGVLQIDTIHVVARSPFIVLWSRLGAFDPDLVLRALEERRIYEYWSHEACWLPARHRPFSRVLMLQGGVNPKRTRLWQRVADNAVAYSAVLDHIAAAGEGRAADFAREIPGSGAGWWDWKPEKVALEDLFAVGRLTVARRERFHRVYRRWEDQFPQIDDTDLPTTDAVADEHVRRAAAGLGVGTIQWLADYFRRPIAETQAAVARLVAAGGLVRVELEGEGGAFASPAALALRDGVRSGRHRPTGTTLLSPLDPVVWHRARALSLFGFDYRIECYTPEPLRRYGYFSLPILHEGRLVGRLDPKAHRGERRLEIRAIHLEPGVAVDDGLLSGLAGALVAFASWQELDSVDVVRSDPPILRRRLGPALRSAWRADRLGVGSARKR